MAGSGLKPENRDPQLVAPPPFSFRFQVGPGTGSYIYIYIYKSINIFCWRRWVRLGPPAATCSGSEDTLPGDHQNERELNCFEAGFAKEISKIGPLAIRLWNRQNRNLHCKLAFNGGCDSDDSKVELFAAYFCLFPSQNRPRHNQVRARFGDRRGGWGGINTGFMRFIKDLWNLYRI